MPRRESCCEDTGLLADLSSIALAVATPGGISAHEIRHTTRLLSGNKQVRGFDITEIDASKDSADGRTVRLAALLILEAASGHLAN